MLDKLLQEAGVKSQAVKIQLGRGVVGRSSGVALGAMAVIGMGVYRINGDYLIIAMVSMAVLVFAGFFREAMKYADKNPAAALLEGSELVTWRKQELAAKYIPDPPKTPAISDPKTPLSALPAPEGSDQ